MQQEFDRDMEPVNHKKKDRRTAVEPKKLNKASGIHKKNKTVTSVYTQQPVIAKKFPISGTHYWSGNMTSRKVAPAEAFTSFQTTCNKEQLQCIVAFGDVMKLVLKNRDHAVKQLKKKDGNQEQVMAKLKYPSAEQMITMWESAQASSSSSSQEESPTSPKKTKSAKTHAQKAPADLHRLKTASMLRASSELETELTQGF